MPRTRQRATSLIRAGAREEIPEIESVIAAAFAQYRDLIPAPIFDAYAADSRNIGERWDEAEVLVAEHQGRIAGTITFYDDASREGLGLPAAWAGFRTLAVHPAARGHGLGRKLTLGCVDKARRAGESTVGIHTAAFMTAACGIYEQAGFRRCPEHDLRAADILGLDDAGEVAVIAYRLDIATSSV